MQKVAAFLLERIDGMECAADRANEAVRLRKEVDQWLRSKGASEVGVNGTYRPEDGSAGSFKTVEAVDQDRTWWMVELEEVDPKGKCFSVALSITAVAGRVSVYVTLETGWTTTHIAPVPVDPRCPKIIGTLLDLPGRWYHGTSPLRRPRTVSGFDDGEALASDVQHPERTVPLVIVSTDAMGEPALPDLATKLGNDLAGLANVVVPDEDASWALTDALGTDFTCYRGAVRLFWPQFERSQDRYRHPLWTAERLRSGGRNRNDTRERFRKELRSLVFRAAALSVVRPRDIDAIRDASGRQAIVELRQRATSLEEYEKLADSYAVDNDQLRQERLRLQTRVDELELELAKLESERVALRTHLRAAKQGSVHEADELAPASEPLGRDRLAPQPGEIRFYKKKYSRPTHDIMVSVQDCGCNNWEPAHAADKARKGIAKLEDDRADWKSMQHCASCTGGGMWRVRW